MRTIFCNETRFCNQMYNDAGTKLYYIEGVFLAKIGKVVLRFILLAEYNVLPQYLAHKYFRYGKR